MNLIELQTTGSTNDYAKELAREGAASGTVIRAHEQTAGRGRQGNSWISMPGNLFMSLILRPAAAMEHIGQLSFLSAVALANVLGRIIPSYAKINLKWPNDLLVNGKKAAGILIETENSMPWVIIGIGLNITTAPEGAVSLHGIGAKHCEAGYMLELIAEEIMLLVKKWERGGFDDIRNKWLHLAYKLGEEITIRLPKEKQTGIFAGIDRSGELQLKMPDGIIKTINSGEVFI